MMVVGGFLEVIQAGCDARVYPSFATVCKANSPVLGIYNYGADTCQSEEYEGECFMPEANEESWAYGAGEEYESCTKAGGPKVHCPCRQDPLDDVAGNDVWISFNDASSAGQLASTWANGDTCTLLWWDNEKLTDSTAGDQPGAYYAADWVAEGDVACTYFPSTTVQGDFLPETLSIGLERQDIVEMCDELTGTMTQVTELLFVLGILLVLCCFCLCICGGVLIKTGMARPS